MSRTRPPRYPVAGGFGAGHWVLMGTPLRRLLMRWFGINDLHSHLRWHAVRRYVDFAARRTLEVGAGTGVMTFEVARRIPGGTVAASEYDARNVELARTVQRRLGVANVELSQADLRHLGEASAPFDQALAIDVLEHVDDDAAAVRGLARSLRPGGRLVVSVPTPRYPEVFGRAYHESIGHLRDGYRLEDLEALLAAEGLQVTAHRYYTGRVSSWVCGLYYRRGLPEKVGLLALPLAQLLCRAGERFVGRAAAASLVVVARRTAAPVSPGPRRAPGSGPEPPPGR